MGEGVGVEVGVTLAVGVDVRVPLGVVDAVREEEGVEVWDGVGLRVSVGDSEGVGECVTAPEGVKVGVKEGEGVKEQLAGTGRPGVVQALGQGQSWQAAAESEPEALLNVPEGQGCAK